MEADLEGGGTPGMITFHVNPAARKFVVPVAASSRRGTFEVDDEPPQGFSIVDIDKKDACQELMVVCPGAK